MPHPGRPAPPPAPHGGRKLAGSPGGPVGACGGQEGAAERGAAAEEGGAAARWDSLTGIRGFAGQQGDPPCNGRPLVAQGEGAVPLGSAGWPMATGNWQREVVGWEREIIKRKKV